MDRAKLWNAVEAKHKRGDAIVAREFEVSLPKELTDEQRQALAFEYAAQVSDRYKVAADANLHGPDKVTNLMLEVDPDRFYIEDETGRHNANWHMHLQLSACYVDADGVMGKKCVELDPIHVQRQNIQRKKEGLEPLPNAVDAERKAWADICNRHLEAAGHTVRVDHRSFADQGIDQAPTTHHGTDARAIEQKTGQKSDRRLSDESAMQARAQEAAAAKVAEAGLQAEIDAAQVDLVQAGIALRDYRPAPAPVRVQPVVVQSPAPAPMTPQKLDKAGLRGAISQLQGQLQLVSKQVDEDPRVMKAGQRFSNASASYDQKKDVFFSASEQLAEAKELARDTRSTYANHCKKHPVLLYIHKKTGLLPSFSRLQEQAVEAVAAAKRLVKAEARAAKHFDAAVKQFTHERDALSEVRGDAFNRLGQHEAEQQIIGLKAQLQELESLEREDARQDVLVPAPAPDKPTVYVHEAMPATAPATRPRMR